MGIDVTRRRWAARAGSTAAVAAMGMVANACGGGGSAKAGDRFPSRAETFVLLHGSWHGGWCWQKVRSLLQAQGFDTLAPTFTGMSDRARYGSLSTGLAAHIDEVASMLEALDLSNVVLVGHSYAGIVISGVAERAAARIGRLVYLDAFALRDGESAFTFFPPDVRDLFIALAQSGNGWGVPPPPTATDDFLGPAGMAGSAGAADRAFLEARLTLLPLSTHSEALSIPTGAAQALPRTYISCLRFPNLDANKARVRQESGWDYREIDTYHDCMLTAPDALTALLVDTVR
jgi:pimeloyl-ACP methyl ester carboxylesterase